MRLMIRHVLAIYRATPAGHRVVREASAIATEHGAQLTIAVVAGDGRARRCCGVTGGRWDALLREAALRELEDARLAPGQRPAHLAVIEGSGPRAIAGAAHRMRCDLVVVPLAPLALRGGLARAVRSRTEAMVIGVRAR
jgi:hypothetical protein